MTMPRKSQISLADTKYYHCISRCVRHSYLCGKDSYTGKSYEHRRQWIEDKLFFLASIFCIDICAYAVMSNHVHTVLHVDDAKAKKLSDKEVLQRWHKLFKGTILTQKYLLNIELTDAEQQSLNITIAKYRERLFSLSWFMRILNEDISRKANKEDECTGRFWEGRFKSQALLDEAALAACMAYVDLNPIRAQMAKTPEKSNFTSIKKRIEFAKKGQQPATLFPFISSNNMAIGLPFDLASYVKLVEKTGRCISKDKSGFICEKEPILSKIDIAPENWLSLTTGFTDIFHGPVGKEKMIQGYCDSLNRRKRTNITNCRRYLA